MVNGSSINSAPWQGRIIHISDVEGDWDYLTRSLSHYAPVSQLTEHLILPDDHCFVFGGDAVDGGPGDLAVVTFLVALKERYPDRVVLLAGNRDVNKLRFLSELRPEYIERTREHDVIVPWRQGILSFHEYLEQNPLQTHSLTERTVAYLKWMLQYSMGAPHAFEFRAQELDTHDPVAILNSFRASIAPGGILAFYLKHADLVKGIGNTLFVHGALTPRSCPNRDVSVTQWIEQTNRTYHQQLDAVMDDLNQNYSPSHLAPLVYSSLSSDILNGRSLMTETWLGTDHIPHLSPTIATWLHREGYYRVVAGHAPCGDHPIMARTSLHDSRNKECQLFIHDLRYSTVGGRSKQAAALLCIHQSVDESYGFVDGVRHDGLPYHQTYPKLDATGTLVGDVSETFSWVGKKVCFGPSNEHWLVTLENMQTEECLLYRKIEFDVQYRWAGMYELRVVPSDK
ncbi:MAG: metallophosphoesterase [Pseudomonadota bacterium]